MFHPPIRVVLAAALASCLLPLTAHAASTTVTFTGGVSGVDPLGQAYDTTVGPYQSSGIPSSGPNAFYIPTFGETASTNGGNWATYNGNGLADARSFTFTYTGTQPLAFNLGFDTGFSQDDGTGAWNTQVLSANTIRFTAPGAGLKAGTQFDFIVGFVDPATGSPYTLAIDPGAFSFSATWSDAVPEPATWSMMIVGLGLLGGALRQRKAVLA